MRKEVLSYKDNPIVNVLKTLSKTNQKLINDFLEVCKITASNSSIKKIKGKIVLIADTLEKDMNKLTLEDVRSFLVLLNKSEKAIATKNDTKKVFKRFLRENYKNWSLKFNGFMDIKLNTKQEKRDLSKGDLLTPDEMQIIINSVESLKYKTILVLM